MEIITGDFGGNPVKLDAEDAGGGKLSPRYGLSDTALAALQAIADAVEALAGSGSTATVEEQEAQTVALGNMVSLLSATLTVQPQMASGGNIEVQTANPGNTYVPFGTRACKQLTIVNDTGTTILAQQGGSGVALPIFDQASFSFFGLSNANQIGIRRKDGGNAPVTAQARWES